MNPELAAKWDEAAITGQPVEIGESVVCDFCSADFTTRPDRGGLIFGSNAVCPLCAPVLRTDIARYGEERYVRAECPDEQSFGDFVRAYRERTGSTTIHIVDGHGAGAG